MLLFRFAELSALSHRLFPPTVKWKYVNKDYKNNDVNRTKNSRLVLKPSRIFPENTQIATENFYLEGHVFFFQPRDNEGHLLKVHCSPVQDFCTENYKQFSSTGIVVVLSIIRCPIKLYTLLTTLNDNLTKKTTKK